MAAIAPMEQEDIAIDVSRKQLKHQHHKIDMVLVYDKGEERHRARREFFQSNLRKKGVVVESENVPSKAGEELVFVKLHVPFNLMCKMAEVLQLSVPIKQEYISSAKVPEKAFNVFNYVPGYENKVAEQYMPHRVCWPYDRTLEFIFPLDSPNFFTPTQRFEVAWELMQRTKNDPGKKNKRGIEQLLHIDAYKAAYPPHDGHIHDLPKNNFTRAREELAATWANWLAVFKQQPIHLVRYYLGEQIAFYFAFLDFYTKWLIAPALAGLAAFIYGMAYHNPAVDELCDKSQIPGNYTMCPICVPPNCEPYEVHGHEGCDKARWEYRMDTPATIAVSLFLLLWAPLFLKFWKRRESTLAFRWGTYAMKEHFEPNRPEYDERARIEKPDSVTGRMEPYVPITKRWLHQAISFFITLLILFIFCCCLAALVVSRVMMYKGFAYLGGIYKHYNIDFSRWTIHAIIFVLVQLFEKFYHPVAEKLTEFEAPRTQSQFYTQFLWKIFIFEIASEFLPIFYAAFVKGSRIVSPADLTDFLREMCELGGCMGEVLELTAVLLVARLALQNLFEIGVPMIKGCVRLCCYKKHNVHSGSFYDRPQYIQDYYANETEGVWEECIEMLVQLAFVTLLVPAFPLAPLVCLLNNILEIRIDAQNFIRWHRRSLPERSRGLQLWNLFLDILIKCAVIVNGALIAFTSEMVPRILWYKEKHTWRGYGNFSLTRFNLSDWHEPGEHEPIESVKEIIEERHIDVCYYEDFRESYYPYKPTETFWEVETARLCVFIAFVCVFFAYQWLVDTFIPDTPHNVSNEILRRDLEVNKLVKSHYKTIGNDREGDRKDRNGQNYRRTSADPQLHRYRHSKPPPSPPPTPANLSLSPNSYVTTIAV